MLNSSERTVLKYDGIYKISAQGELLVLDSVKEEGARILYLDDWKQRVPTVIETGIRCGIKQIVSGDSTIEHVKNNGIKSIKGDVTIIRYLLDTEGALYKVNLDKATSKYNFVAMDHEKRRFKKISFCSVTLVGLLEPHSGVFAYIHINLDEKKIKKLKEQASRLQYDASKQVLKFNEVQATEHAQHLLDEFGNVYTIGSENSVSVKKRTPLHPEFDGLAAPGLRHYFWLESAELQQTASGDTTKRLSPVLSGWAAIVRFYASWSARDRRGRFVSGVSVSLRSPRLAAETSPEQYPEHRPEEDPAGKRDDEPHFQRPLRAKPCVTVVLADDEDACPPAFLSTLLHFFTHEEYTCELRCTTRWMVLIYILVNQEKDRLSCIKKIDLINYNDLLFTPRTQIQIAVEEQYISDSPIIYKLRLLERIYKSARFPYLEELAIKMVLETNERGSEQIDNEHDVFSQLSVESYDPIDDSRTGMDMITDSRSRFRSYVTKLPFLQPEAPLDSFALERLSQHDVATNKRPMASVPDKFYDEKLDKWFIQAPSIAQKMTTLKLCNFKSYERLVSFLEKICNYEGGCSLENLDLELELRTPGRFRKPLFTQKLRSQLKRLSLANMPSFSLGALGEGIFTSLTSLLLKEIDFKNLELLNSENFPQLKTLRLRSCFNERPTFSKEAGFTEKNNFDKLNRWVSGNESFCKGITSLDISDNTLDKKDFDVIFSNFRSLTMLNLSFSVNMSAETLKT
jgi:hypothetical protein